MHAEAFATRVFIDAEWDWRVQVAAHSPGWVTARQSGRLVGFVNVVWDGLVCAWLQDTMVAADVRGHGVRTTLITVARHGAMEASVSGCT